MRSVLELVKGIEVGADADSLRDVLAAIDHLQAKAAVAVGGFEASGEWEIEGATSATAWLREHAGMSSGSASWLTRCGRRMRQFPVVAAAWIEGLLNSGQVQAIVANTCDATAEMFAEHEAALVPVLAPLDVAQTSLAMQQWRSRALDRLDQKPKEERPNSLFLSRTLSGRGEMQGTFEPENTSIAKTALRLAESRDENDQRTPAERRADAFIEICRFFLDNQQAKRGGRHRPHVSVVVREDPEAKGGWLATLEDGTVIPHTSLERLLCDCTFHRVVTDKAGGILDYGRSVRTAPPNLFNALVVRDRNCRFCDRPPEWCEAHHVQYWEDGGCTSIDNLVLACSRHHHLIHAQHWRLRLEPDGVLQLETPDGRAWTSYPPGMLRPNVAA